ncbi:MAG: methyltransferase [Planctomycetaceae bacterium]|nr:methyltransferase [Planctomycetaceae bacterium]
MKVGTDAIALGAWAQCQHPTRILDVGTGCGLIALMLAQRFGDAMVDAVEPDISSAEQARQNFADSPWSERLHCQPSDIQQFQSESPYDLVVCNPPFFQGGPISPQSARAAARHEITLTWHDLLDAATRLLSASGSLCVVLPSESEPTAIASAQAAGLFPRQCCRIRGHAQSPVRRVLLQFIRTSSACRYDELTIELRRHEYTPAWATLTAAFLLNTPDPA